MSDRVNATIIMIIPHSFAAAIHSLGIVQWEENIFPKTSENGYGTVNQCSEQHKHNSSAARCAENPALASHTSPRFSSKFTFLCYRSLPGGLMLQVQNTLTAWSSAVSLGTCRYSPIVQSLKLLNMCFSATFGAKNMIIFKVCSQLKWISVLCECLEKGCIQDQQRLAKYHRAAGPFLI